MIVFNLVSGSATPITNINILTYFQYVLDISFMLPEIFLVTSILSLVIYATLSGTNGSYNYPLQNKVISWLSCLILIFTFCLLNNSHDADINLLLFNGIFVYDNLALYSKSCIVIMTIACLLISRNYVDKLKLNFFEYHLLILLSILGLILLTSSNDLISMYLAIEMQSLSFYVLAAFKRKSAFSTEAGLKYFILGAFSSGLILFGCTFVYGLTGTLNFDKLNTLLQGLEIGNSSTEFEGVGGLRIFILFIATGLLFKLAAAPFHMWSPDVYEGSPTSSTILFAVVPKLAIFVLFIRIFHHSFYNLIETWQQMLIFSSIISVVIGSFVALKQRKLKRLIAYSAVSHVGYLLLAVSTGTFEGNQALFFYMFIYMITGVAIWCVVLSVESIEKSSKNLSDLTSLIQSNSTLAITFSLILFSLAGIPPLSGFYAKMYVFFVAIGSKVYLPAITAILLSVISTFYYIRIIKIMAFDKSLIWKFHIPISQIKSLILGISFFLIVILFVDSHLLMYYDIKMVDVLACNRSLIG